MEWPNYSETDVRVSVLLHPLQIGSAPLLWHDWSRRVHRRACIQLVRHQRIAHEPAASCCHFATCYRSDPVPCAADTLTSRLSRAVGSQCPFSHRSSSHDQALWHPCHVCYLARVNDGLIPRLSASRSLLLGYLRRSERHLMALFPSFPSSSAFFALYPADSSIPHAITLPF
jgi:hypothetical protein